ncbi:MULTISPECIES: DNA cytosine methyltransferase [Tetragenococcus]|uniref:DNA cytosine methyltransferase n=1 Tax=Tetragenococcus TaxID=51668 RepID=UPI00083D38FF|nr:MULTISPECIES: DNA cytosine methyltransferase [Tetragenococcus]AOF48283.1 DNA methylase [Tetragenococcus halophilus]AYW46489.1 DNA cytosine methyltransferase [Tetragenococcus koreensis]MCF1678194.1 DNA cytosine methyltransferase [Tetragenococcus koreensis]MCO8292233.1 DNA cytosine methyltransferase [Tetragenococcus halophilus]GEN92272.1 cytosine-specific methyltransferase [Tetragenococcus koreensis]
MRGGYRKGSGRKPNQNKKVAKTIYLSEDLYEKIRSLNIDQCNSFNKKCLYLINSGLNVTKQKDVDSVTDKLKFIDLFAGIGGIRQAFEDENSTCVFSSEWDKYAQKTYEANYNEKPEGDITKIKEQDIPEHDILLAGFPCQPFSMIGKREGFKHATQGTLFFDVLRIISYHKPKMFLLENVPGLLTIQSGEAFNIIYNSLINEGYDVFYKVLDAQNFNLPQIRKRLVIVGMRKDLKINTFNFPAGNVYSKKAVGTILETAPDGYSISKHLQDNYLFKKNDGKPQLVDKNSTMQAKTLVASYHKIQRLTGTFVKGGETGIRLFSKLECKRLMGFPDEFVVPVSRTQMYKQFGNSVAVPMMQAVASEMKAELFKTQKKIY